MNIHSPTVPDLLERLQTLNIQLSIIHGIFILNRDPVIARFSVNQEIPQLQHYPYIVYLIFDRYNLDFNLTEFISLIRPAFPNYIGAKGLTTLHGQPRYNDIFGSSALEDRDRRTLTAPPANPWNPPPASIFVPTPQPTNSSNRRADSKSTPKQSDQKSTSRSTPSKLTDESHFTQLHSLIANQQKQLSDMAHQIQLIHTRLDAETLHSDPASNPFLPSRTATKPAFVSARPPATFNHFSSLNSEFETTRPGKIPTLRVPTTSIHPPRAPPRALSYRQTIPVSHTSHSTPVPIRHNSVTQPNTQPDPSSQSPSSNMDYYSDPDADDPDADEYDPDSIPYSPSQDST